MPFETNVFINCPFDKDYILLLRPLLFTVMYCKLAPKISETRDGGEIRVNNIKRLIRESRFSIHDISRSGPMAEGEFPRFNMPYEMGLDLGCKAFGGAIFESKRCLILERTKYQYQRVISDIAGQDISTHADKPKKMIEEVRNWFVRLGLDTGTPIAPATVIWRKYIDFTSYMNSDLRNRGYKKRDIEAMPFSEYIAIARNWIAAQP